MSENARKPSIRFAGFDDAWEQRKLIDIVYRITEMSNKMGLPRVEYEDINSGLGTLNKDLSGKHCNKQGVLFQADDVLFGKLRPYLKNWLMADFSGIAVGDFWVLRSFDTDSSFIYTLIQSDVYDKVANRSTGTKMPRADWSLVSNTYFEIPHSKAEQHQIGTFFHQLDNLITLHQRKYDKLVSVKKSMLEKMFPKNGSNIPEIRFSGFTDPWEQRKLLDVVDVRSGQDYKHLSKGDIPVYGTGGYMLSVDKALSYTEDAIGIGRKGTIDKPYFLHAPFWTVDTLFYAVPRHGYSLEFIHSIFQRIDWKRKDESTGVPSLSKATINDIEILVPESIEQKRIGTFFTEMDNLITLHQRKLEKLKNIKKSMLEKMFV